MALRSNAKSGADEIRNNILRVGGRSLCRICRLDPYITHNKSHRKIGRTTVHTYTVGRCRRYYIINVRNVDRCDMGNAMYKFDNGFMPQSFLDYFAKVAELHS